MIEPTVGRIVWYHPGFLPAGQGAHPDEILPYSLAAAIICYVHSRTCVNLSVFDANGVPHSRCSVRLVQDKSSETPLASGEAYCEWMPYQRGQSNVQEKLEARIADLERKIAEW